MTPLVGSLSLRRYTFALCGGLQHMSGGIMAKKKAKRGRKSGVNLRAVVTDALQSEPSLSPTALAERLSQQGTKVRAQYVANIKSDLKKQGKLQAADSAGEANGAESAASAAGTPSET